jgi:hypothetical protein
MFARVKKSGKYPYLQIVENRKVKVKGEVFKAEGVVIPLPFENYKLCQRAKGGAKKPFWLYYMPNIIELFFNNCLGSV